ncbi:MAG: MBL fold metallo-hydrolase [Alphaproteobacteria bacterium]|nr:MBL fold metallo-hydrolase [Alphaproteobacteria bacterium]MCB9688112.1 MBL fold metallo-hydrolase [Alphaproteobacteria bacterium]
MWFALLVACSHSVTTRLAPVHASSEVDLDAPGPLRHTAFVSARWSVPAKGLIDLDDPRAAEVPDERRDIVLPVHVLEHPTAGTFVIDTGVPRDGLPVRGLLAMFTKEIETEEPLGDIIEGRSPLSAVLLTHSHLDHVLGLPDVPSGVPVMLGPGDEAPRDFMSRMSQGTFARALGDHPLMLWSYDTAPPLETVPHAVDVIGDGSLWALSVPGHTPGSTAYLARTEDGPVLFTGDCSHTRWGWDHGVAPGTYTEDHERNVESLGWLEELARHHASMQVFVGHEL